MRPDSTQPGKIIGSRRRYSGCSSRPWRGERPGGRSRLPRGSGLRALLCWLGRRRGVSSARHGLASLHFGVLNEPAALREREMRHLWHGRRLPPCGAQHRPGLRRSRYGNVRPARCRIVLVLLRARLSAVKPAAEPFPTSYAAYRHAMNLVAPFPLGTGKGPHKVDTDTARTRRFLEASRDGLSH